MIILLLPRVTLQNTCSHPNNQTINQFEIQICHKVDHLFMRHCAWLPPLVVTLICLVRCECDTEEHLWWCCSRPRLTVPLCVNVTFVWQCHCVWTSHLCGSATVCERHICVPVYRSIRLAGKEVVCGANVCRVALAWDVSVQLLHVVISRGFDMDALAVSLCDPILSWFKLLLLLLWL